MNKRILSLCLALVLLLCLLPAAAPTAAAAGNVAINKTNFPDVNFRVYVSENFDQNSDGVLSPTEISDVTEISCLHCGIASLKGIEFFTALETLDCNWNNLTSLDVSKNTALETLKCYDNQLSSLDVSKNTALESLNCSYNQLTSLDVSGCTALKELLCSYNQLTSLEVSRNTALKELSCFNNGLTSLDVSGCSALDTLYCGCNQLTALDVSKNQNLSTLCCHGSALTVLDLSAVPKLLDALENGHKEVDEWRGVVKYSSEQGYLVMDVRQKTVPETVPIDGTPYAIVGINIFNFPDKNFRSYVKSFDFEPDGVLHPWEINKVKNLNYSRSSVLDSAR